MATSLRPAKLPNQPLTGPLAKATNILIEVIVVAQAIEQANGVAG
jgi:hypothetical protein